MPGGYGWVGLLRVVTSSWFDTNSTSLSASDFVL